MTQDTLRIRGARVHNLRGVDLEIPHGKLVVFTGVSGSGKTSLGVHTLHAEGRRRYVASLSAHARAVAETLPQPDVDWIGGLNPTLAIGQHATVARSRSTVGTLTEIHDHLRGLFARFGLARCPTCGQAVAAVTVEDAADQVLSWPDGTRVMILAPLAHIPSSARAEQLVELVGLGFVRARIAGEVVELTAGAADVELGGPDSELVIDRWIVRADDRPRLVDSLETARRHGDSLARVHRLDTGEDIDFPARPRCGACREDLPSLEPSLFSFNQPHGMCAVCDGLGETDAGPCAACGGTRLCAPARGVTWHGRTLPELSGMEMGALRTVLSSLVEGGPALPLEREALSEILARLAIVERLGLAYLSPERGANTLSAGELRRLRLAGQVASTLTGITYILDEPTAGLHPRDTARLVAVLEDLRDQGNTVVAIEHAQEVIRAADHLVDFGPGAGREGGRVVAHGTVEDLINAPESVTGAFLARRREVTRSGRGRVGSGALTLSGAAGHNLKNLDLQIPVGAVTVVTGVSGSGKTSLVAETLAPAVAQALGADGACPLPFGSLIGAEAFEQVVPIDGRSLGRSPRSNPATVTRIFDAIRQVFAATSEARVQGYDASRFSFNAAGGRCEVCDGLGELETAAHLLTDIRVPCHGCQGARYNQATLRIRYKGANIADVLAMSVDEALGFFERHRRIHRVLTVLHDVGLGYLPLGRSATTLSGGESQRIKLSRELGRARKGARLLILDEPDSGLHQADVERLVGVLDRLVEAGDTVVAVAHRPDLVWAADHVVDLGPGPGRLGGTIVVQGTPEAVAADPSSATGAALAAWRA
jgi:excinuclease ABC subunit A